jgi:hypothetical protein
VRVLPRQSRRRVRRTSKWDTAHGVTRSPRASPENRAVVTDVDVKALAKLREPFPPAQIGKLPKGGLFLDFIGHGYITARLLDVDPLWSWRPMAVDASGLPQFDEYGGLWIELTVCGTTRLGYGDAGGKKGPNAVKEAVGDALRNSAMRFGAGLDLWCKGDPDAPTPPRPRTDLDDALDELGDMCAGLGRNPTEVATEFIKAHKKPPRQTDAKTVRDFIKTLQPELSGA